MLRFCVIDWASLEGGWLARTLAFGAALSFALYSLATRGARTQDLDAALVAVGIVTALICAIAVLWRGLLMATSLSDAALALVLMPPAIVPIIVGSQRRDPAAPLMLVEPMLVAGQVDGEKGASARPYVVHQQDALTTLSPFVDGRTGLVFASVASAARNPVEMVAWQSSKASVTDRSLSFA